jgi:hypothetical protein
MPPLAAHARPVLLRIAAAVVAAFCVTFAADAVLFRTPLYPSLLEPDSSAGVFELVLARERQAQAQNGDNLVVTLGDSRFSYLPRQADELTPETGYVFRHAGVAGTDARAWFYMMRDLDPTRRRYKAIVIGVSDYEDEDGPYDVNDDTRALHYTIARLRLRDVAPFAFSFPSFAARWEAFRGALLKGFVYQSDLQAFLTHPLKRLAYVRLSRKGFAGWTWDYQETPRSMAGLEVNWRLWKATYPPQIDERQRDSVEHFLLYKPFPQTGSVATFRRRWFGRLIDAYRGSPTRIIFLRLPRGPVVRPANLLVKQSASIRELAARPRVTLEDEHAYDSLEHPELFQDALHLNREGVARFSAMLARNIRQMLGPARTGSDTVARHAF